MKSIINPLKSQKIHETNTPNPLLVGGLEQPRRPNPPTSRGAADLAERGRAGVTFAMVWDYPTSFAGSDLGARMNVVGKMRCWDSSHEAHLCHMVPGGQAFQVHGLVEGNGELYTFMDAKLVRNYPRPLLSLDESSTVMRHDRPTWSRMCEVVELCSGLGGMTQGLMAAGFVPVLAVDFNERMLKLYQKQGCQDTLMGDISCDDTVKQIWNCARGSSVIAAGYACQPFSRLGDQRGELDARAMSLRGVLATAFFTQAQAVILECVTPAAANTWVKSEIQKFIDCTGFSCTQSEFHLHEVWPSRRSRAWWVLTAPWIGQVDLPTWPLTQVVTKVAQVIPRILAWDPSDEKQLLLKPCERPAFGVEDGTCVKYLLNHESQAPCALHSWGSQLLACECGCRSNGLSMRRLEEKGLFGLLVRSASDSCYQEVRHIHPNECLALQGFDPVIDFGDRPRLTLAAAGQMASPLQAIWVFSCLADKLSQLQFNATMFGPKLQFHAYQAWVLMRCRQVWPVDAENVDSQTVSLMQFWKGFEKFSMRELMHPMHWPTLREGTISVASVLDAIIRDKQSVPRPVQDTSMIPEMIPEDEPEDEDDPMPTPWLEQSLEGNPSLPAADPSVCKVIFFHEFADPITTLVSPGCTIHDFVQAHEKLVGDVQITTIVNHHGIEVSPATVLELGQVICIRCEDKPATPGPLSQPEVENDQPVGATFHDATVSPTVEWTHPAQESTPSLPEMHQGQANMSGDFEFDSSHSWVSAAPLMGLTSDQLLKLRVPAVINDQHLWALRNQVLTTADRLAILGHQGGVWSDDEFRHHLASLIHQFESLPNDKMIEPKKTCFMIDPLLVTGWIHHGTSMCQAWGDFHPEIKHESMLIVTACLVEHHWVPLFMCPQGERLSVHTWDSPHHDHTVINQMCEILAQSLGYQGASIERLHRMFFVSDRCGALAMSFLSYSLRHTMLPTSGDEAELIHQRLRDVFRQSVAQGPVTTRPWIWGAGDADDQPPMPDDMPEPSLKYGASASHVCMTRDQRLTLLREHHKQWGDDEIRYHILHMLAQPNNITSDPSTSIHGFVMLDPLTLFTWDTVGKRMCEAWCRSTPQVRENKHHVVTALLIDEHWSPLWIAPCGNTLVAHMLQDGIVSQARVEPLLEVLKVQWQYEHVVFHWTPQRVPSHNLCGAAAISFLGHLIVHAELPDDINALLDMHANMKASFVQALYQDTCCRCPVAWGSGPPAGLTQALSDELAKHGVPDDQLESRVQQAIRVIGAEPLQNAMKAKNVWRSLKTLGNNARFQFILPEELSQVVESNRGAQVGKRPRNQPIKSKPAVPEVLDPTKLTLLEGAFRIAGAPVPQIAAQQIGPVATGIAFISHKDASPFLKNGKPVSNGPLAMIVLHEPQSDVQTALPHLKMMIPCICSVNQEPLLVEATVVQLGVGLIEKHVALSAVALDPLDVVTVKIMTYRDEYNGSWEDFVQAPIKHLVACFPILRRCFETDCKCECWHNPDGLQVKVPIMDVWRRQFLNMSFRPVSASKSAIFSVSLRVPSAILGVLLARSGHAGSYLEPRTPDGKNVLDEYLVVWTPKMSLSELAHLKQMNPAVIGVARLGGRRGLRVLKEQAQAIHAIVRPEATFLPGGPKTQYVAGPFPWGTDRAAITRAMKQVGWLVQALQPMQPVPGKGSMWLLQSVEMPQENIICTSHGEVVITKHKQQAQQPKLPGATVGSANTLSLCGSSTSTAASESDPWLQGDPWGPYKAKSLPSVTTADVGMQQLEERIQSAVLSKLPATMEDNTGDRLSALEGQVHQLMAKNQALEGNFNDFSHHSAQQFAAVQTQIQQQSSQFHGQLESQSQSIQAMFEQQMQQIRGLLSKRPRDENME